jgi:hypothetical protein
VLVDPPALTSAPPPIALTVVAIRKNRNTFVAKLWNLARSS